jgi:hypothetical protein
MFSGVSVLFFSSNTFTEFLVWMRGGFVEVVRVFMFRLRLKFLPNQAVVKSLLNYLLSNIEVRRCGSCLVSHIQRKEGWAKAVKGRTRFCTPALSSPSFLGGPQSIGKSTMPNNQS